MERSRIVATAIAKPTRIGKRYAVVYTTVPRPAKPRRTKPAITRGPMAQGMGGGARDRRHRTRADLAHMCR